MSQLIESIKENLENITPMNTEEIRKTRHSAEKPLFVLCVIITVLVILIALFSNIGDSVVQEVFEDEDEDMTLLGWVIVIPIFIILSLYYRYGLTRAYAIRVSEKNFPEIY